MSATSRLEPAASAVRPLRRLPGRFAETQQLSAATQPLIRTGRLTLRRPEIRDATAIAAAMSDHRLARMLVRVPQPYHVEDAEDWLKSLEAESASGWIFAITKGGVRSLLSAAGVAANGNEDGLLIGVVAIEWRDDGANPGWHLGFWLDHAHRGQGLMVEAANAVIARFFSAHMGETLHSGAIADNPASLKVQERLGFAVTGVEDVWCVPRSDMVKVITTELTFGGYMPM